MRLFLFILAAFSLSHTASAQQPNNSFLVQIIVTYQEEDPLHPWLDLQPNARYGYGVVIDANRVLTTEPLIRYNRHIELRRPTAGVKTTASVVTSDPSAGLAILRTSNQDDLGGTRAIHIAKQVPLDASVKILQLDGTSNLRNDNAHVLRASVTSMPSSANRRLLYSLLASVAVNGPGAVVIYKGKLAGLVQDYHSGTRVAQMEPCTAINSFITDTKHSEYTGIASAGFTWSTLVDPTKRRFLGIGENIGGVIVHACLPGSGAFDTLRPNDVIIEWDGHVVDNLGFYNDRFYGRIEFTHLVNGTRQPNDVVPVTVVRDRRMVQAHVALSRQLDRHLLIPENVTDTPSPYLISGGLVIRELSGKYIRAHGSDWRGSFNPRLAHMYLSGPQNNACVNEHVVILAGVLADPINIGYQHFSNELITHINDQPVLNINDVFRIVDADDGLRSVRLKGIGVDLVLSEKNLKEADKRVAHTYRISNLRREATQ
ncbi:MAG: hypothetical protein JXN60_00955 [Lentisphaerae bacterium]|nr:hypothetical protein [Lentisphaerota bacterium]